MSLLKNVQAHCDIPCKIYDPAIAQIATLSVIRLLDLIAEEKGNEYSLESEAKIARLVLEKEEQATIVKNEINIIWGDYFKEPQIEMCPTIHTLVHSIMQAGSKCKQELDPENGAKLLDLVNNFASMFWETKAVSTRLVVAPYPPALGFIQPVLPDV